MVWLGLSRDKSDRVRNGNRTKRLKTGDNSYELYEWDHRNRLTKVEFYNSSDTLLKTIEYAYDAFNRMVRRTFDADGPGGNAATDQFFAGFDGIHPTLEFDDNSGSDLTHRYLWGLGADQLLADEQVTSTTSDGDIYWTLGDQVGTIRDIGEWDSGTSEFEIANHREYDSFGNLISQTNSSVNVSFGFTGKWTDPETGYTHHLNRWFDPVIGKWLSEDPIGFEAGDTNVTRYVTNRVLSRVDSNGLEEGLGEQGLTVETLQGPGQILGDDGNGLNVAMLRVQILPTVLYQDGEGLNVIGLPVPPSGPSDEVIKLNETISKHSTDTWASWIGGHSGDTTEKFLTGGGKIGLTTAVMAGALAGAIPTGGQSLGWGGAFILGGVGVYEADQAQAAARTIWTGKNVNTFGSDLINRGVDSIAGQNSTAGDVGGVVYDLAGLAGIFRSLPVAPNRIAQLESKLASRTMTRAEWKELSQLRRIDANDLQQISRWGRPGLQPNDWVMNGSPNWANYFFSFKWQPGMTNKFAPFGSGETYFVPKDFVSWPSGWGVDGWWKGLFNQRIFRGPGS